VESGVSTQAWSCAHQTNIAVVTPGHYKATGKSCKKNLNVLHLLSPFLAVVNYLQNTYPWESNLE